MTLNLFRRLLPRSTSFEPPGSGERGSERYQRALLTTLSSVFSRGVGLLVLYVSTRAALPYLGAVRFGVWVTISTLTTAMTFLDLGIGNSLVAGVAETAARANRNGFRKLVVNALTGLAVIGAVVGAGGALAAGLIPLDWLYKGASPSDITEARRALEWFCVLFGLSMPLQAVHRIFAGLQEGYVSLLVSGVASVGSLALIPLLPHMGVGVPGFLLATYGLQVISGAVSLAILHLRFGLPRPHREALNPANVRILASSGGLFFVLQVTTALGWDLDPILLSALSGPATVSVFSVVQRMFLLVSGPLTMINAPLWPAYADASARGDIRFIQLTLRRSMTATLTLAALGAAGIFLVRTPLCNFLSGGTVRAPMSLALMFAVWTILSAAGDAFSMYLNGLRLLVPQVFVAVSFLIVALILKLSLTRTHGALGIVSGTLLAYLLTAVLMYATVFRRTVLRPLHLTRSTDSALQRL